MSLVITSNDKSSRPNTAMTFKPYSYQNNLINTMKIPPNSEIALHSAKIQKEGTILVDKFNNQFFHYFGPPLGTAARPDFTYGTSLPMWGMAGDPQVFIDEGQRREFNTDDYANSIQDGMDAAAYHPSFVNGYVNGKVQSSIDCEPNRTAGGDFQGYKWTFTQNSTNTTENATFNLQDISERHASAVIIAGGTATADGRQGFHLQDQRRPLSQDGGECVFDISGANFGAGTRRPWTVGLSRINSATEDPDGGAFYHAPPYYNPNYGARQVFTDRAIGKTFYDIAVARDGDFIKVFQSGINNNFSDPAGAVARGLRDWDALVMNEITYFGAFNLNFKTAYANAATGGYTKVKFQLKNEEWVISLYNGMAWVVLCEFTSLKAGGGGKLNLPAPNNQCKWAVYPTMTSTNHIGAAITLESYDHYAGYPVYDAATFYNWDYWGGLQYRGLERWGRRLERGWWNDKADTTSGLANDGILTPLLVVGGGMGSYESVLIMAPSRTYGIQLTETANAAQTFGFRGRGVAEPTTVGALVDELLSSTTPDLVSTTSLFIRLNNFTQNSVNARKGTISKIVAHLPRFDNSGNEAGALFYEPHERAYLSLNNTEELSINSFDIEVVYDDETLATSISGKSVIIFHIRQRNPNSD